MSDDPELKTMATVFQALQQLDLDAQARVLKWIQSKLLIREQRPIESASFSSENVDNVGAFETVADLLGKAHAKTDSDRVLLVAAFLQQKLKKTELSGREINHELHHIGHGVKNITNAISSQIDRKPQLIIQTRKEGKSQQAQKKYKVTVEGFKVVNEMLLPPEE